MPNQTISADQAEAARKSLAPNGRVRVGIAVGPAGSAVWATRDPATGKPRGVTVALAKRLEEWLGVPVDLVEYGSSGQIVEAAAGGGWDVAFAPIDEERKKSLLCGPNYALGESTYMVAAGSPIASIEEVDRPGVRVVGVENTATIRSARRTLKATDAIGVAGLDEAVAMLRDGRADAIALGRESLQSLAAKLPGARILDGHFHAAGTAIVVPPGRPEALPFATDFIEQAKADGTVRRAFDENGMAGSAVAPAGSRS